jgi:hypothetical protein
VDFVELVSAAVTSLVDYGIATQLIVTFLNWSWPMAITSWNRTIVVFAFTALFSVAQFVHGALLLNYQFESVDGSPPSEQTTPDSSGNFTSTPGTVNAVLGHGTNTPGTDFPILVPGPVANLAAGVMSRNAGSAMNFPGNPAIGNIASNIERVEIADASAGALDAAFTNFTVALWLNPSSTDRDRFAIGKIGGSGQRGWQISSTAGTTNLVIDYFDSAGATTSRTLLLTNALPLNTWNHVIFAFDGVNQTEAVYVNNVLQTVDSSTSTLVTVPSTLNGANSAAFRTGHRGATGNSVGSWAGGIDDVVIFNETLAFSPTGSQTGTGSLLAEVPEPGTLMLSIFGVGLTLSQGRARRHRSCQRCFGAGRSLGK